MTLSSATAESKPKTDPLHPGFVQSLLTNTLQRSRLQYELSSEIASLLTAILLCSSDVYLQHQTRSTACWILLPPSLESIGSSIDLRHAEYRRSRQDHRRITSGLSSQTQMPRRRVRERCWSVAVSDLSENRPRELLLLARLLQAELGT